MVWFSRANCLNDINGSDGDEDFEGTSFDFGPLKPHLRESRNYLKAELNVRTGIVDKFGSVVSCVQGREMCTPGRRNNRGSGSPMDSIHLSHVAFGGFSASQKAYLANSFLPNRRKIISKLPTKTFCCQYTQSGNALLTASQDEKIRIFERRGFRQKYYVVEEIRAPFVGWGILDLIVSPDDKYCVYSTWSDKLYQCKLDASEETERDRWTVLHVNQEFDDDRFAFFSIRMSCDGSHLIGGASDGNIYIYDREIGQCFMKVSAHEDDVNSVCVDSANEHVFFSGSDDGICKVWDNRDLADCDRPVGAFAGHRDGITFIDSRGDGRYILTNSKDQTIKLWDIRRFSSEAAQERTRRSVSRQSWDYRYEPVPRNLTHYEPLEDDGSIYTFRGGHLVLHTLIHARFSPLYTGQRYIYTGCARGACILYDVLTGVLVKQLKGHRAVVRECVWHPYENEIVTTAWDGVTALWRFDERTRRNINPECDGDGLDSEDTSDEYYQKINACKRRLKRRVR